MARPFRSITSAHHHPPEKSSCRSTGSCRSGAFSRTSSTTSRETRERFDRGQRARSESGPWRPRSLGSLVAWRTNVVRSVVTLRADLPCASWSRRGSRPRRALSDLRMHTIHHWNHIFGGRLARRWALLSINKTGTSPCAGHPSGASPMMDHATKVGNRLLAALPPADFALLAPHLRKVALERDSVLVRSGDRVEHLLFPQSGAVAAIMELPNGQTVATAIIGQEGAIGLMSALGGLRSPMTAVVRIPGSALQIPPVQFLAAQHRSPAISAMVQVFTRSILAQFQHVAACNALHSVEARLARWLLQIHDRANGDDLLPLTQETLSELLGVRRTTVTLVVSTMRASRALKSSRRGQLEIDRPRLEAMTCECYKVMSRRIDRIVSQGALGHFHGAPTRNAPIPR